MKKISLVIVVLLGWVSVAVAQNVVIGKVVNENNKAIAGVEVSLKGSDTKIVTDANGEFNLKVVDGSLVTISKAGFENKEISISSNMNIVLKYGDIDFLSLEDLMVYQDYYLANNKKCSSSK